MEVFWQVAAAAQSLAYLHTSSVHAHTLFIPHLSLPQISIANKKL